MSDQFADHVSRRAPERRAHDGREELMRRVTTEFREMAGLSLTHRQACRLFNLEPEQCARILNDLVSRGVLRRNAEGLLTRPDT